MIVYPIQETLGHRSSLKVCNYAKSMGKSLIFFILFWNFTTVHDLHLSICNLEYNVDENRIEIEQRIFIDDLENAIKKSKGFEKFNVLEGVVEQKHADLLLEYYNDHFDLAINGKKVDVQLLEYSNNQEAFIFYFYIPDVKRVEEVSLISTILFELFDDQSNVVSLQFMSTKKSENFTYKSKPMNFFVEN